MREEADFLIFFILSFCFIWVFLYTFNPGFVKVKHEFDIYPRPGANPDPVKCFAYAILFGIVGMIILYFVFKTPSPSESSAFKTAT